MTDDWTAWQTLHVEPASLLGEHVLERFALQKRIPPVRVIVGENDSEGSHRSSERLYAAIPGAKMIRVANAGHWFAMEQPGSFSIFCEYRVAGSESVGKRHRCLRLR